MPMMKLNRNAAISAGMAYIVFVKNVPQEIHPSHVQDVMAIGALPCDEADIEEVKKVFEEDPKPATPGDSHERMQAILAAIGVLVERQSTGDFTAGGAPHAKRLQELTGWEISATERDTAWERSKEIAREQA